LLATERILMEQHVTTESWVDPGAVDPSGPIYRAVVEAAPTAIVVVDADGRIVLVNREMARMFGYPSDQLLGGNVEILIPAASRAGHAALYQRYLRAPQVRLMGAGRELKGRRNDATEFPIEIALNPIATGTGISVLAIITDITGRKLAEQALMDANTALRQRTGELAQELEARRHAEAALVQAQRMEAVGQLTAGVAHDFNNLLQGIFGALALLREQAGLGLEGRECVAIADQAARRGATLVHRLLAFSRKQSLDPAMFRPEQVLVGIVSLLAYSLGDRIAIETVVEEGVWPVRADVAQLENCLFNLAFNARDAMPEGGRLLLRISNVKSAPATTRARAGGEYVCFAVEDTGVGMPPETLARAFEPFFTTKPVDKGTGLGLSMVQGFARQSGGDAWIDSVPGRGTTVSIWLPRGTPAEDLSTRSAAEWRPATLHGRGRVLVVDDEASVRNVLSLMLAKAGFSPVAVDCGEEALRLLQAGEPCDLLITDHSMGGMTGLDLIGEAAKLLPRLPALLISGYDMVKGLDQFEANVLVLRKPFERETLLFHVDALISGPVAGHQRGAPATPGAPPS
jgi:PAS domain S-box-containing protein